MTTSMEGPPDADSRFEERVVAIVLFVAGIVGVGIGVSAPRTDGAELALGALVAMLGVWTWFSDHTHHLGPGAKVQSGGGFSHGRSKVLERQSYPHSGKDRT